MKYLPLAISILSVVNAAIATSLKDVFGTIVWTIGAVIWYVVYKRNIHEYR